MVSEKAFTMSDGDGGDSVLVNQCIQFILHHKLDNREEKEAAESVPQKTHQ